MPHHVQFQPRLLVLALAAAFPFVHANPNGAQVVLGSASLSQPAANVLQLDASSHKTIVNWQQFSIGQGESVRMNLPGSTSAILNRVTGGDVSQILGSLQSNGRVFLINPSGIVFGQGARIDTAGFIASTLGMSNADFLADRLRFDGPGGQLAQSGDMVVKGDVALIANALSTSGTIRSDNGNLMLAAGQTVELVDLSTPALRYQISAPDNSVLNLGQLLVQNGAAAMFGHTLQQQGRVQALRAETGDGGSIVLRADNITLGQGASLQADAQASGQGGTISLVATGAANVHGTLSARGGEQAGDGGFVETSGHTVNLGGINVDTRAAQGKTGQWLIDPADFTVAASGGDITGAALSAQLAQNNITLDSRAGSQQGQGDVLVNDNVSWAADTTLTLQAERHVVLNSAVSASGQHAGVTISPGAVGSLQLGESGRLDLTGSHAALSIAGNQYQLIRNQDELVNKLAAEGGALAQGYFAIGADFRFGSDFVTRQGLDEGSVLQGLGHTLSGQLQPLMQQNHGFITNTKLAEVNIHLQGNDVGAFARQNIGQYSSSALDGSLHHVSVSGAIRGFNNVGALVGMSRGGRIEDASVAGNVSGAENVGGLLGSGYVNFDGVENYADVNGVFNTGGIVGDAGTGSIRQGKNYGHVSGVVNTGGLAGFTGGLIEDGFAVGVVSATGDNTGGLVGRLVEHGNVWGSEFNGQVHGVSYVGGLVGKSERANWITGINRSSSSGLVSGTGDYIGGVAGYVGPYDLSNGWGGRDYGNYGSSSSQVIGRNYVGGVAGYVAEGGKIAGNFTGSVVTTADVAPNLLKVGPVVGDAFDPLGYYGSYVVDGVTVNGRRFYARGAIYSDLLDQSNGNNRLKDISEVFQVDGAGRYIVNGLADFRHMLTYADAGGYNSYSFVLHGDVDLSADPGFSIAYWSGSLYGNGHVVQNYSFDSSVAGYGAGSPVGLFGYVTSNGRVENVTLNNANIEAVGTVGLFAGTNAGTLDNIHVSGAVVGGGDVNTSVVGGLVGLNTGQIINSSAHASVNGAGTAGGLVGLNEASGRISLSSSNGVVSAEMTAGGLVGLNVGSVHASASESSVNGSQLVGGLIGSGSWDGLVTNSFYNVDSARFNGERVFIRGAMYGEQFERWQAAGRQLDIDSEFSRDASGRYQLQSLADWRHMLAWADSDKPFVLTSDIDLSGDAGYSLPWFTASLDGGGHVISNLTIQNHSLDQAWGLFGVIDSAGAVSNLQLQGARVEAMGNVGLLAGLNKGTVSQVVTSGQAVTTANGSSAGGLVGLNLGTISTATSHGTVSGDVAAGGLVGYNTGSILDAANHAAVSGTRAVGGLVGSNAGAIDSSANLGRVSGNEATGGLVGANSGSINASTSMGDVRGSVNTGGLAGENSGFIDASRAGGTVTANDRNTGGLVGLNEAGTVQASQSDAAVNGVSNVGGLVGLNNGGAVLASEASGNVLATLAYAGGLVGYNHGNVSEARIEGSTASGSVQALDYAGGLVGISHAASADAVISQSSASGAVRATGSNAGGIAGGNDSAFNTLWAVIEDSQSSSAVAAGNVAGGLVGYQAGENARLANSAFTGQVTVDTTRAGVMALAGGVVGKLEAGSVSNSFYNVDTVTLNGQKVFTRGAMYGEQFARWQAAGRQLDIDSEFGNDGGRYQIHTLADWRNLLAWADGKYRFDLNTNLDLSGDAGYSLAWFAGDLDGRGHTLSNLTISNNGIAANWGLFGNVLAGARVSNLNLAAANVSGYDNVGMLAGSNAGTLEQVSASGIVSGGRRYSNSSTGGLVGANSGTIVAASSQGEVNGDFQTGGLVGYNTGLVTGGVSTAAVAGYAYVGGLVGANETIDNVAVIEDGHASGAVNGVVGVGGLVGRNLGGRIVASTASGKVTGTGAEVGGLVGSSVATRTDSVIETSSATGDVLAEGTVGGLVGMNSSGNTNHKAIIRDSQASGSVTARSNYAGGLVGHSNGTSIISGSLAASSVSGRSQVGGLVGYQDGANASLVNSYAQGVVTGNSHVGGAVGYQYSGLVQNVYANVAVNGTSNSGGLLGKNLGTVGNSYWQQATAGTASSAGGTGLDSNQIKQQASFTGWDFGATGPWRIIEGNSMPYLAWQFAGTPQVVSGSVTGGAGQGVTLAADGNKLGFAYSGADSRFYMLTQPGSGSMWMAYTADAANVYQGQQRVDFANINLGAAVVSLQGDNLSNARLAEAVGALDSPLRNDNGELVLAEGSTLQHEGGSFTLTGNISGGAGQRWLGEVSVTGDDVTLSSYGDVDFAGDVALLAGSRLTLAAGGSGGRFDVARGARLRTEGDRSMASLSSSGLLSVHSGDLQLNGGGTLAGELEVGGRLAFESGGWSLQDGLRLTGSGRFASELPAQVSVDGSQAGVTVASDASVSLFDLRLGGTGKLVNLGTLSSYERVMGLTLDNRGTATLDATTLTGSVINSGSLSLGQNSDVQQLRNEGTLAVADSRIATLDNRAAGSASLARAVIGQLDNAGGVQVDATSRATNTRQQLGTLAIADGESLITDTGSFDWQGGQITSTPGGLAFQNGGQFIFNGDGERIIDGLDLFFTNTANSPLLFDRGSLVLRSGSLTLSGTTLLGGGTSLVMEGGRFINNSSLSVAGEVLMTGGSYEGVGTISLQAAGKLNRPQDSTVNWLNTGVLSNTGTLDIAGGTIAAALNNTGTMNIGGGTVFTQAFTNTGVLNLLGTTHFDGGLTQAGGSLQLGSSGSPVVVDAANLVLNGGALRGAGTINGSVSSQGGRLAVGYSPGELVINGNLTLDSSTILDIELGGTTAGLYDRIVVNGQANLAGTANVLTWNGFTPASDFSVQVMRYQTSSGAFASVNVPTANYQLSATPSGMNLAWQATPVTPPVTPPVVPPVVGPTTPSNPSYGALVPSAVRHVIRYTETDRLGRVGSGNLARGAFLSMSTVASRLPAWAAWADNKIVDENGTVRELSICQ
jgi:filamentous hemagglutinin family protein